MSKEGVIGEGMDGDGGGGGGTGSSMGAGDIQLWSTQM